MTVRSKIKKNKIIPSSLRGERWKFDRTLMKETKVKGFRGARTVLIILKEGATKSMASADDSMAGENSWDVEEKKEELKDLAKSCGLNVVISEIVKQKLPTPATYLSQGKIEFISQITAKEGANLVIFDRELSSTQQRNLEDALGAKVVDRTSLILEIFAQHANSREGKLQVELAQLNYLLPRLTGTGVLLSRLGGGIGTRGPGEMKLEVDRRRIRERIGKLNREIKRLEKHRKILRESRERKNLPLISLVGYTNVGKSTLLNTLSKKKDIYVDDRLFSTLDPRTRVVYLPDGRKALFTDTVGLLRNLPHHLISSFKATLEELRYADLLLNLLDASSPFIEQQDETALFTLQELGINNARPILTVLNKKDLIKDKFLLERVKRRFPEGIFISAITGEGLEELKEKIANSL
ncbi:MAG: GTPase HflX [Candidatus Omnitrophica bacterium]|nr:GTPase HflX [Candidatus Omnitrophota bacterium]